MILHKGRVITRGETSFEVVEKINRPEVNNNGNTLFNFIVWGVPAILIAVRMYS